MALSFGPHHRAGRTPTTTATTTGRPHYVICILLSVLTLLHAPKVEAFASIDNIVTCAKHERPLPDVSVDENFPEEIPASLVAAHENNEDRILVWSANVDTSISSGYGDDNSAVSGAWPGLPGPSWAVVTESGFFSALFNFTWEESINTDLEFFGYVADESTEMSCFGFNPSSQIQFMRRTYNATEGPIYWTRECWSFSTGQAQLNERFHQTIVARLDGGWTPYEEVTICVGEVEFYSPSIVLPPEDPDSEETLAPIYQGGWTWIYTFVQGLEEGSEAPWGYELDQYVVGEKVQVRLEDDQETCEITYGGAACQSCTSCGLGTWQGEKQNAQFSADCSNLENGRITDCENTLPFYLPVELELRPPDETPAPSYNVTYIPTPSPGYYDDLQQQLDSAKEIWNAASTGFYDFVYSEPSVASMLYDYPWTVEVRDGAVVSAVTAGGTDVSSMTDPPPPPPRTIDELFSIIQDAINMKAYSIYASYSDTYGYPDVISIDYDVTMADEERYFEVSSFTQAPPGGPPDVVVKSTLDFGFFPGANLDEGPRDQEIRSVMEQISAFYTDLLRDEYPNFGQFEAKLVDNSFDPSAEFPVRIEFDANVFFTQQGNFSGATIPSKEEVFAVMENADYGDFIMNYVWNIGEGLFRDTQRVQYDARIRNDFQVVVESTMDFGFFEGTIPDEGPSEEEIESLNEQINAFYRDLMNNTYDSFDMFEALIVETSFDPSLELPFKIKFDANVSFSHEGNSSTAEIPSEEEVLALMTNADYEDFIQNYVWNTNSSFLSDVNRVEYNFEPSPESVRVVVESNMGFGFYAFVMLAEPRDQEIANVMEQINAFYSGLMMNLYPNFDQFEATLVGSSFNLWTSSAFPFRIEFDANVFFSPMIRPQQRALQNTEVRPAIPSKEELFAVMENADYEPFIKDYVWSIGRETLFFYTQRVKFNTRPIVGMGMAAAADNRSFGDYNKRQKKAEEDTTSYYIKSELDVTFFPGMGREPSQDEMDALLIKTDEFLSERLAAAVPNFVSLDIRFTTVKYDDSVNKDKVAVGFEALIKLIKEPELTQRQLATILSEGNYNEFIADYMRKTKPWAHSVFDNTLRVVFKAFGSGSA